MLKIDYMIFNLCNKPVIKIGKAIVASHHTLICFDSKEYLPHDFASENVLPERPPSYSIAV